MSETYCGKKCDECMMRSPLNCTGCEYSQGNRVSSDCKIAKCCQEKGHETCDTCSFRSNCITLRNRHQMPDYRLEKQQKQDRAFAEHAAVIGNYLWIIFMLLIIQTIAKFFTRKFMLDIFPYFHIPGQIVDIICSLAHASFLMKLSAEDSKCRIAGICAFISHITGILVIFFFSDSELVIWAVLLFLPTIVFSLIGVYNEYMAYSNILRPVDKILSSHWRALWKWFIASICGMFGALIIFIFADILGCIILIADLMIVIVVSILQMVYLYRSAKVFKNYNKTSL